MSSHPASSCSDRLRLNPHEHPILLTEPAFNTQAARAEAVKLMFEKFSPPALFVANSAVLSSFASGRQTSLVVDLGHDGVVGEPSETPIPSQQPFSLLHHLQTGNPMC